jgi:hypothetical protein
LAHDSEPSPSWPSHFAAWVGTTEERTRILGNSADPNRDLGYLRCSCRGGYLLEDLAHGPDEASQFTRDRGQRLGRANA